MSLGQSIAAFAHPHSVAQCDGQANGQGWGAHRAGAAGVSGREDAECQLEGQNHFRHHSLARSRVVVELQGDGVLGALPSSDSMARNLQGWGSWSPGTPRAQVPGSQALSLQGGHLPKRLYTCQWSESLECKAVAKVTKLGDLFLDTGPSPVCPGPNPHKLAFTLPPVGSCPVCLLLPASPPPARA